MGYWIKVHNRPKGQIYKCSKCRKDCNCIAYLERNNRKVSYCNYDYCPHCSERMEVEVENDS